MAQGDHSQKCANAAEERGQKEQSCLLDSPKIALRAVFVYGEGDIRRDVYQQVCADEYVPILCDEIKYSSHFYILSE
jgi:hypothetical protein